MRALWVVVIVLAIVACGDSRASKPEQPVGRAFYYWRTSFALSPAERATLTELGVKRLYVRVFDI